jgi:hypothetical protein
MKKDKISRGVFLKGQNKIMARMKPTEKKTKFMSVSRRTSIYKSLDHYDKTKDLPTI